MHSELKPQLIKVLTLSVETTIHSNFRQHAFLFPAYSTLQSWLFQDIRPVTKIHFHSLSLTFFWFTTINVRPEFRSITSTRELGSEFPKDLTKQTEFDRQVQKYIITWEICYYRMRAANTFLYSGGTIASHLRTPIRVQIEFFI